MFFECYINYFTNIFSRKKQCENTEEMVMRESGSAKC